MIADLIRLDRDIGDGLGRQLFFAIRNLIEQGQLAAGMVLPSSRQLALDLGVGRNTVLYAYEQLVLEGYLHSDGRRGTRVSEASRGFTSQDTEHIKGGGRNSPPKLSQAAERIIKVDRRNNSASMTFLPGMPDVRSFPHDDWGRLLRRAARQGATHPQELGYSNYSGCPALKQAIIDHVSVSRGVVAEPDQVLVLSSAQASMDLVARVLLDPGDVALHEEPGYSGMLAALRSVGADCRPIPMAREHPFADLASCLSGGDVARLIYATPSHQFPTGRVMNLRDRLDLLAFAQEQDGFVLEDDYDSEFHFTGAPISSLQGLDRQDLVIYMGTFAKSLMPAIHVAYLIVPKRLAEPMRRALRNMGSVPSAVVQRALSDFLKEGYARGHIARMGKLYEARRDCLVRSLERHCAQWLMPFVPEGGIQMPVYLTEKGLNAGIDDRLLAGRLAKVGIETSSLSSLHWSGTGAIREGLLLGYAASDETALEAGVERIARLLEDMTS